MNPTAKSQWCRVLLVLSTLITLSTLLRAQSALSSSEESQDVRNLILSSIALEPELTADVFLKLVAGDKIKSKKKKQLLQDAFYLSYRAKYDVRRKLVPAGAQVLTNQTTFVSNAHAYGLDTVSLQTRAINELSKFNPKFASELIMQVSPKLPLRPLTCGDELIYSVSDFYAAVAGIARSGFSQKEIIEGKRVVFLLPYLDNMISPTQTSPISRMLSQLDLRREEMNNLAPVFNRALRKIKGDDRSFSYSMNVEYSLNDLAAYSRKLHYNHAAYDEFLSSLREYIVFNLSGARCESNLTYELSQKKTKSLDPGLPENAYLPKYVRDLNAAFYNASPISAEEIEAATTERFSASTKSDTGARIVGFRSKLEALRFDEQEIPSSVEKKQEYQWQQEFLKLLDFIAEMKSKDSENEMETFHLKCLFYRLMLRETPEMDLRRRVVKNYVALLNESIPRKTSVSEWFLEFDSLRNEISDVNEKDRPELEAVLEASNNNAIAVYLELQRILKARTGAAAVVNSITPLSKPDQFPHP